MGDEQDGLALLFVQLVEQVHHHPAGGGVQRAGGFVRQQHRRIVGHGPRDGDPLLLAAGKLVWLVTHPLFHAHQFQQLPGPGGALCPAHAAVQHGQLHIFHRAGAGDQVEGLEHKADLAAAQGREGTVRCGGYVDAVQNIAALGGFIQRADDVHQGGFAAAGLAHDGHKFPLVHFQIDAVEDLQFIGLADVKPFYDVMQLDNGLFFTGHSTSSRSARLRSSMPSERPSPLTSTERSVSMPVVTGTGVKVTPPASSVSLR